jgi:hypothetical protein
VHCSDEGAAAASDHSVTNFSTHDEGIEDRGYRRIRGSETDRWRVELRRLRCKPITDGVCVRWIRPECNCSEKNGAPR